MKILHIVEDFSVESGGLRTMIKNLDFQLKKIGYSSFILSSKKEQEDSIFLVETNNKWLYSKNWTPTIDTIVRKHQIEIIHIHGVWLFPQFIGAKYAIKNKIPFVLSSHGMYQPWLWKKSTLKKKLYFNLLSKKSFSRASIIHTITPDETKNIQKQFKNTLGIEIPNLISLSTTKEKQYAATEKYILYLGRLNKTKGIDLLIKAFFKLEDKKTKLKIAGANNAYRKSLESLVSSLGLSTRVEFLGLVKASKEEWIRNAWLMVSASYSDVIGMVNLEAASFKTPMITTYNVGLKDEWNTNGGKLIHPNVEELLKALTEVLNWTLEERNEKGNQLFNFVKQYYSWESRIEDWKNLYERAIEK